MKSSVKLSNNGPLSHHLAQQTTSLLPQATAMSRYSGANRFSCSSCGFVLFSNNELVEHHENPVNLSNPSLAPKVLADAGNISVNGHKSTLAKCACHFIRQTPWMDRCGVKKQGQGFLTCEQCQSKVGQYSFHGLKCNCGQSVAPAF
mmetsp:Transcript_38950/g.59212  ORF Transcript_38950/g.59212 Transcript_38950/m.59212 type:complete len:147 (-) Transcript_38950:63-503(-)